MISFLQMVTKIPVLSNIVFILLRILFHGTLPRSPRHIEKDRNPSSLMTLIKSISVSSVSLYLLYQKLSLIVRMISCLLFRLELVGRKLDYI